MVPAGVMRLSTTLTAVPSARLSEPANENPGVDDAHARPPAHSRQHHHAPPLRRQRYTTRRKPDHSSQARGIQRRRTRRKPHRRCPLPDHVTPWLAGNPNRPGGPGGLGRLTKTWALGKSAPNLNGSSSGQSRGRDPVPVLGGRSVPSVLRGAGPVQLSNLVLLGARDRMHCFFFLARFSLLQAGRRIPREFLQLQTPLE